MPTRTAELEDFFVHSPEVELEEIYLDYIRDYARNWNVDRNGLAEWIVAHPNYGWSGFEPNDAAFWQGRFINCKDYFKSYPEIRTPFAIVFGICALPESFRPYLRIQHGAEAIPGILAAIQHAKPFRWEDGDEERWLFGCYLWKLNVSEHHLGEEELRLLFLDAVDSERRRFERLRAKFSGLAARSSGAGREKIPEEVRIFVWRRDGGRCIQCGSQEKLEFDHIIPFDKGGSNTERNLQLLCEPCNRIKGNRI